METNKTKINKTIGILWSGGFDSTLLVYRALKAGYNVTPIYVNIQNNASKTERELAAKGAITKIFHELYPTLLSMVDRTITVDIYSSDIRLALAQAPIWILGLVYNIGHIDEFHIGYVMNDDAISYLDDLRAIYQSYQSLVDRPLPELLFPLSKTPKYMAWDELPDKIRQLTTFCERGHGANDCGECGPCKRYIYEQVFHKYDRNSEQEDLKKADMVKEADMAFDKISADNDQSENVSTMHTLLDMGVSPNRDT